MNQAKRKPSWTLCVNDARSGERPRWRNIGAAWETERGNLFVKIDAGERLDGTAMMFPYREKPAPGGGGGGYRRPYPDKTTRPTSDYTPARPLESDDYMERQRAKRASPPPTPPPNDDCPDPQAPDWL